jgi:Signal transduction histidine kinase
MKIGARIFFSCLVLVFLCLSYPLSRIADTIGTHYREGVEDALADQANILASLVEEEIEQQRFSPEQWRRLFDRSHSRSLAARIYELAKDQVDSHVYITDEKGIVLFDSGNPDNVGRNFSSWRDVHRALQGQYGARTTRNNIDDPKTSTLYVAAPIRMNEGKTIVGVLTVIKPTTNIRYFVDSARRNILESGIFSLATAGLLSFFIAAWITRPIKRLTQYARSIRDGEHPALPKLDKSEIGEMGRAFAEMQETLEGRRYVEQYVEHLTHELKSPLSAIRGAAELLGEPMDEAQRQRFIANINSQSRRIQDIVDRMLELASLESRSYQRADEIVRISALVHTVCESKEPLTLGRNLRFSLDISGDYTVKGDSFLLHQALANLVQNALDFSPDGGTITVMVGKKNEKIVFTVCDQGPGIPDYAQKRIFQKFFSLQRPHSQQKSTGLGLNFVRQIAILHGGLITLHNLPQGGAQAQLEIPCA